MKNKLMLTFFLAVLLGISAYAQSYVILVQPAGSKDWGYADLSGNLILDAKYKKAIGFSEEGYAAIYDPKLKQFYFIDIHGETLQTEIKDYKLIEIFGFGMKGFNDGFAPVKLGEKWGYMNTEGKLSIAAKYDKVTVFNGGYASVQNGKQFLVVDHSGREFSANIPGLVDLNDFSENLAVFKTEDGKAGFLDGNARVAIQPKFDAAGDFHGGLAWAKTSAGMIGFINPMGEWVIEPNFDAGKNFDPSCGLARIKKGDKWGYLNMSGEVLNMEDTDLFEDFSDGLARGRKNDKFGYFNDKMEWAIQPQFDGARDFKNGYASVRNGSLWGVIDRSGNWVIEPRFEDIKDVEIIR
jgi:hypothetical protein